MNKEQKQELNNWFNCFQNGVMTYFHLFTTVSENDRYNIGSMCFRLSYSTAIAEALEEYPEAIKLMDIIEDELCELDTCEPNEGEYQDHFMVIFDAIGQIRHIANIQYDFYVDNNDDKEDED